MAWPHRNGYRQHSRCHPAARPQHASQFMMPAPDKPRILVVEDEMLVARDLAEQLLLLGYEPVGQTTRGEEVLPLAKQVHPDLVLMDIHLAGAMDGIAAAQQIRSQLALPVVFLTAFDADDTLARAKLAEPYGYLLKPFSERELRAVLEMALYKCKAEALLLESTARSQSILDNMIDGVITLNARGIIQSCNPATYRLFGYSADEMLDQNVAMLMPEPHHKQHDRYLQNYQRTGQKCVVGTSREVEGRRKDGSLFPLSLAVSQIQNNGENTFIGILRDLSLEQHNTREIHRLARANDLLHVAQRTYGLILAGGRGSRLYQLTNGRSKPAVPFGGKLKIIDFPLSNCVNSGIRRMGVLTQYKAQSLIRHIERGWGFLEPSLNEYIDVVPAQQQINSGWYSGTADAVYQNLGLLDEADPSFVLILAGDHIYKMDYTRILADHINSGADLTVACIELPIQDVSGFGVMAINDDARVTAFEEKPANPTPIPGNPGFALASMGIYVFNTDFLREQLRQDAANEQSSHDFGRDFIPRLIHSHHVQAHRFTDSCVNMIQGRPYWRDVGTVDAYWEANMDLTHVVPDLNLYDDDWPILSVHERSAPAKFVLRERGLRGMALDSLVSNGCIVSGATVCGSVLFTNVRVAEHSRIEDSVLLPEVVVGRNVIIRRAVVDNGCIIPDGFQVGVNPDADRARFHVTARGITLITPEMLDQPPHRVV